MKIQKKIFFFGGGGSGGGGGGGGSRSGWGVRVDVNEELEGVRWGGGWWGGGQGGCERNVGGRG